jgi:hypothetical protein
MIIFIKTDISIVIFVNKLRFLKIVCIIVQRLQYVIINNKTNV